MTAPTTDHPITDEAREAAGVLDVLAALAGSSPRETRISRALAAAADALRYGADPLTAIAETYRPTHTGV